MKVGLFFGSFNPIHSGHLILANYFAEFTDLKEVWFVVSPHNPLKEKKTLLNDYQRYDLVCIAIEAFTKFKACDIEFRMPKPSYTIDTLAYLSEKYPSHDFVLLTGADNLQTFHKWKNYQVILDNYQIYVYPRPGYSSDLYATNPNIKIVEAPLIEISSSFIRDSIKKGKNMIGFLPLEVYKAIEKAGYYSK